MSLVEEFAAITGWSRRLIPVACLPDVGYRGKFLRWLGITAGAADLFFVGNMIDMVSFVRYFSNVQNKSITREHRFRALSFCLFHRDAFEGLMTEGGLGDPRVMDVVMQVEEGKDPSAIILAGDDPRPR